MHTNQRHGQKVHLIYESKLNTIMQYKIDIWNLKVQDSILFL